MAVELTKVALWIETIEPGKPLGFLDANIRCGDALLGVFDLEALRQGIPGRGLQAADGRRQGDRATFRCAQSRGEGRPGRARFRRWRTEPPASAPAARGRVARPARASRG